MTKHTMVTFQLHRKGVILIVILALVVAVLLVAAGYMAAVMRPRPAAAKPAAPAAKKAAAPAAGPKAAPKPETFTLRVGLATSEEEAQAEVKSLAVKKLKATVVPAETSDASVIYEIHVGSYAGRAAAANAAAELKKEHGIVAAVVPAP